MSDNPLLQDAVLPLFSKIKPEHIVPAVDTLLAEARAELASQLAGLDEISYASLVAPIEARGDRINKAWSPVSHMHSVVNSDELRAAYSACIGKLSDYSTEFGQNTELYRAYQQLAASEGFKQLSQAQQQAVENAIRDFTLAGVGLNDGDKAEFARINSRLSELSTQFANNVMDATQGWYKHIADAAELDGLPQSQLDNARALAQQKGLGGFVISLDIPSYLPLMQYAHKRELREECYRAYVSRASAQSLRIDSTAGPWDNSPLIDEILALRAQLAKLLGFNNYAERSIATKMVAKTGEITEFLRELATKSRNFAEADLAELEAFAHADGHSGELAAWDLAYFSEKLKQAKYNISQEELRQYFPAPKVIAGLFGIVKTLFGVDIKAERGADSWHPDVQFFRLERDGELIAHCYLDLYARDKKRGGAWMDECRVRRQTDAGLQLPVAYLVCNFTPPLDGKPSLLSHDEVTTLFHEFGHGLHHMLTGVDVAAVSGINGVPGDAVQLPSQFLENWCWQSEAIPLISGHYQSGEPLPEAMLEKLLAAKNYQAGMQMLRQIEFALFDFLLHLNYDPASPQEPQAVLDEVRKQVAVVIPPAFNKFQNSFSHIFAGGYAAGYYSYKWAEVLSADAFEKFEQDGIFNAATGQSFLQNILQMGGSVDIAELFTRFRGRAPKLDALLRHNGMA
ncbi:MAG: M3 family metallopeptidase [Cellvibrionaceae bacterium]|nr:M3 family metallopeptidase [Cellvibrionaceae bacterium]